MEKFEKKWIIEFVSFSTWSSSMCRLVLSQYSTHTARCIPLWWCMKRFPHWAKVNPNNQMQIPLYRLTKCQFQCKMHLKQFANSFHFNAVQWISLFVCSKFRANKLRNRNYNASFRFGSVRSFLRSVIHILLSRLYESTECMQCVK